MRALRRMTLWGMAAAGAVASAVLVGQSETGSRRIKAAWAQVASPLNVARRPPAPSAPAWAGEEETRRLAEQVRILTADRDRLTARLVALEQSLQELTGSIARREARTSQTAPAAAPTGDEAHAVPSGATQAAPQTGWVESLMQPGMLAEAPKWPLPPGQVPSAQTDETSAATTSPAESTRTEFGVDIGGASSISGLRALWLSIRGAHPALFEGLRPVVMVRDGPGGAVELRLIAGPLVNAGTAARLCSRLADAGLTCQPAVFEGQRLALR